MQRSLLFEQAIPPEEELDPLDSSDADETAETSDIDLVSSAFGSMGTTPPPPPDRLLVPCMMGDDFPLHDEKALKMLDILLVASSLSLSLSLNREQASVLLSE